MLQNIMLDSFNKGKDMDDMMKWAENWKKWATTGDAIEPNADYRASMLNHIIQ